jgi:hypothetical protein
MSWTAYKIVLRLQTPMHIGQAKLGNLQITRPYVHGKALWGALTARITRDEPSYHNDYETVGQRVNERLAFSYFYPTTSNEVQLWPWDDLERFAWHFLGSYASTALDYSQNSAAEGSLHETEFITPYTREGKPVNLVGYIFEREDSDLPWREVLKRLQVGGERTYGWGRVRCLGEPQPTQELFGYEPDLSAARPLVSLPNDARLLAHALAHAGRAILARGRVVPLVGRETNAANAHGQDVKLTAICWEPGCRVQGTQKLHISNYGIWEAAAL